MPSDRCDQLTETLKRAAAALRDAGVPYALGGGLACWAYGAPESDHDVDLMVLPADAARAQAVLADAGMKPVDPPEGWLRKVYDGDVLVDIIFEPNGVPFEAAALARAHVREVAAVPMPVLALEDVVASKLLALNERFCDFEKLVGIARAVREQVDWERVRMLARGSPFAAAFFTLIEGLGIVEAVSDPAAGGVRVPA
ncbi:MAG: nucleotidyltransferase [Mycobacteriales bacterium]